MTATEYLTNLPDPFGYATLEDFHPCRRTSFGLSPVQIARHRAAAYPDWKECTGDDLACCCSWHEWRRVLSANPPDDPYGVQAAAKREDREDRIRTAALFREHLPRVLRDTPELAAEWLSTLETIEAGL